jgi:hypothetical protein
MNGDDEGSSLVAAKEAYLCFLADCGLHKHHPCTPYRTTELANFAGLANSTIFMKLTILVIIAFCVLTGLTYGLVSPKAGLAVATSPSPLVKTHCFIQLLDSLFYQKLHS